MSDLASVPKVCRKHGSGSQKRNPRGKKGFWPAISDCATQLKSIADTNNQTKMTGFQARG